MKTLSSTETELKKCVAYKKKRPILLYMDYDLTLLLEKNES